MKNLFKFGFLALAISLSVAACNSSKTGEGADSTATDSTLTDSSAVDSSAVDSTDTTKTDSAAKM